MTPEHKAELFLQKLAKQGKLCLMSHGSYAWTWQECRETLAAYDVDLLAHIQALEDALRVIRKGVAEDYRPHEGYWPMRDFLNRRGVYNEDLNDEAVIIAVIDAALSPAPATTENE